jgi:hypothetical protein
MIPDRIFSMKIETYSGYKADEYPLRFWIENRPIEVLEVEDRWYSPQVSYFKVFADDAHHYLLKKNENNGLWEGKMIQD